jgi:hypothetical protein
MSSYSWFSRPSLGNSRAQGVPEVSAAEARAAHPCAATARGVGKVYTERGELVGWGLLRPTDGTVAVIYSYNGQAIAESEAARMRATYGTDWRIVRGVVAHADATEFVRVLE